MKDENGEDIAEDHTGDNQKDSANRKQTLWAPRRNGHLVQIFRVNRHAPPLVNVAIPGPLS